MALDPFSTTSSNTLDPNVQGSSYTPVNTTPDPYGFESIDLNTSASSFDVQSAAAGPNLQIITRNDAIVQNRMVFSTVNEQDRGARTLTLRNNGSGALTVTRLNFGDSLEKENAVPGRLADHERAADFKFADTVRLPITLSPGASTDIRILFRPQRNASLNVGDSPTHTLNGENYASLTINSNDPDGATKVNLAGLNSTTYEGDNEASLAEIVRSFGWTTDIGSEENRLGVSRTLFGDEVYSPYWVRADASKPALLFPIAAYSSRSDNPHGGVAFEPKAGSGGNRGLIYLLPGRLNDDNVPGSNDLSGGENQKVLPKILINGSGSLPTTSTVDFRPTSPFALRRGDGWTDDNKNGPAHTRAWRIFPLKNANGIVVPDTWIATTDIGTNVGRNGDFNDDVYLFKNVRPQSRTLNSTVASFPGSPELTLNSNRTYTGNRTDSTSTQLNNKDSYTSTVSYQLSLLDINPNGTYTPKVTNTVGINSDNTLVNGLQTTFDGKAGKATILTKLLEPLNNINLRRQGGMMLNSDNDNYINLAARTLLDGSLGLQFGGMSAQGNAVSDVTYNPLSNSLTALTPLSTGQSSDAAESNGNQIFSATGAFNS